MRGGLRFWGVLALAVIGLWIVGIKAVHEGWFAYRPALDLQGDPALLYFTLSRGCDCQMRAIRGADAQIADWDETDRSGLPVLRIDLIQRRDLGERFGVYRAPALLLVDGSERVIWRQDVGVSDDESLNLAEAEAQIQALLDPGGGRP